MIKLLLIFLLSTVFSPEEIKKIEDAELLFHEGLYEDAINYYKEILKTSLGKEMKNEINFRLGECYFNLGDYLKALEYFERLEKKTEGTYLYPEVIYALGVIHLTLDQKEKAKEYLIEKIKGFPSYASDYRIKESQGIYYFTQGIYETAYEKLKDAISGEGLFYKALTLSRLKRPIEAIKIFKKIQILYPYTKLSEYAAYESAEALFINGDYTGALNLFLKFVQEYGTSELVDYAKYKIGICYLHLREPEKSISYFTPLFGHSDNVLVAHAYLMAGIAMRMLGNYEKSISYLLKAAFNFPDVGSSPIAQMELGKTYLMVGNKEQALITFNQLSNTFSSVLYAGVGDYLTACILYEQGRKLEAQYQLENLIKNSPDLFIIPAAYVLLLKSMIDTRQVKEAILVGEEFLRNIGMFLNNEIEYDYGKWINRVKLMLAEAYYIEGDLEHATRYYEGLVDSGDPEIIAEVFSGLGWCYLESERYDAAIQKFDIVISSYQKDTSALLSSLYGKAIALYNSCAYIADEEERNQTFVKTAFLFKQIPKLFPQSDISPAAIFYAGDAFAKAGYYKNAVDEWVYLLNDYPESKYAGFAAYWLGDIYFKAGELEKSINYFEILINQFSDNEYAKEGYLRLASAYYAAKNFDKSAEILKKFLSLYPEDSLAKDAKSLLEQVYYFEAEKTPEKLEEFAKEFSESELLAQRLFDEALKTYNEKNYEEAIEKAKKVILLFPGSLNAAEAQKLVVASYGALQNYKAMAEEAERFVQYFPDHEDVPEMLKVEAQGLIYEEDYIGAEKILNKIIKNYSSSSAYNEAVVMKSEVLLNLGKFREAIKNLENFSPPEELITRYYYLLGEAFNKTGDVDKAIINYEKLLSYGTMDDPYRIKGLYNLANIYQIRGENAKSSYIYEAIVQITTDENIKKDALFRAQSLNKK